MEMLHLWRKLTRKTNDFNIHVTRVMNTVVKEMPYAQHRDGLQPLHVKVMLYFFSIYFINSFHSYIPYSEAVYFFSQWSVNVDKNQLIFLKKNFFLTFIYFWDKERQSMDGGGSERGRHRIWNRLQALSCQHRARRGAWTHRPRDHDLSWSRTLDQLSHAGTPRTNS